MLIDANCQHLNNIFKMHSKQTVHVHEMYKFVSHYTVFLEKPSLTRWAGLKHWCVCVCVCVCITSIYLIITGIYSFEFCLVCHIQ